MIFEMLLLEKTIVELFFGSRLKMRVQVKWKMLIKMKKVDNYENRQIIISSDGKYYTRKNLSTTKA